MRTTDTIDFRSAGIRRGSGLGRLAAVVQFRAHDHDSSLVVDFDIREIDGCSHLVTNKLQRVVRVSNEGRGKSVALDCHAAGNRFSIIGRDFYLDSHLFFTSALRVSDPQWANEEFCLDANCLLEWPPWSIFRMRARVLGLIGGPKETKKAQARVTVSLLHFGGLHTSFSSGGGR